MMRDSYCDGPKWTQNLCSVKLSACSGWDSHRDFFPPFSWCPWTFPERTLPAAALSRPITGIPTPPSDFATFPDWSPGSTSLSTFSACTGKSSLSPSFVDTDFEWPFGGQLIYSTKALVLSSLSRLNSSNSVSKKLHWLAEGEDSIKLIKINSKNCRHTAVLLRTTVENLSLYQAIIARNLEI